MLVNELPCGNKTLVLDQPRVMGILNVTPDSFSDGGRFVGIDVALRHAEKMIADGADIIDIGGESTRPGAQVVSVEEELGRVIPIIDAIVQRFDIIVSVDTSKPEVMRDSVAAGAGLINDVRALQEPGALEVAAEAGVAVCLMHMQGQPQTMQKAPSYHNVTQEVADFLLTRLMACVDAGLSKKQIVIDPGFGFGKTLEHNLELVKNLSILADIAPVLTGLSRKKMIARLIGDESSDRMIGSVAAAMLCAQRGANIVRVHDVAQTVHGLKILNALK